MFGVELAEDNIEVDTAEELMGFVASVTEKSYRCKDDEFFLMVFEIRSKKMVDFSRSYTDVLVIAELGDGLG